MAMPAGDLGPDLFRLEDVAERAAAKSADLPLALEQALPGHGVGYAMAHLADPAEGATEGARSAAPRFMSRRHGIAIVAGDGEDCGGEVYTSAIFTDGERVERYRKSHPYGDYERPVPAGPAQGGDLRPCRDPLRHADPL